MLFFGTYLDQVWRVDPDADGGPPEFVSSSTLNALAVDPVNGNLFASQEHSPGLGELARWDDVSAGWVGWSSAGNPFDYPAGLAISTSEFTGTAINPGEALLVESSPSGANDNVWVFHPGVP